MLWAWTKDKPTDHRRQNGVRPHFIPYAEVFGYSPAQSLHLLRKIERKRPGGFPRLDEPAPPGILDKLLEHPEAIRAWHGLAG